MNRSPLWQLFQDLKSDLPSRDAFELADWLLKSVKLDRESEDSLKARLAEVKSR